MGNNIDLVKYGAPKDVVCRSCGKQYDTDLNDFDVDCYNKLNSSCPHCDAEIEYKIVEDAEDTVASVSTRIADDWIKLSELTDFWNVYALFEKMARMAELYASIQTMNGMATQKGTTSDNGQNKN